MKIIVLIVFMLYSPFLWSIAVPQPASFIASTQTSDTIKQETGTSSQQPTPPIYSKAPPEAFSYQIPANEAESNAKNPVINDPIQTASRTNYISAADIKHYSKGKGVFLRSHVAAIFDERDQEYIFTRNADRVKSIASLTKLMMAMVILDAKQPMDNVIKIIKADKDRIRYSKSRLNFGSKFTRRDLLLMALLASENRAAAALARSYPGGKQAFVRAMNKKARRLGLHKTHFYDPAGLHDKNVSTARELNKLADASMNYQLIKRYTTMKRHTVTDYRNGRQMKFGNTNRFVKRENWDVRLSKTGFTNTAGNCLIMKTTINHRPVTMVLLNSWGKLSKYGDSNRLKKWLIKTERKIKQIRHAERLKSTKVVARVDID